MPVPRRGEMLLAAAAKTWGVRRRECIARQGRVLHVPCGRELGFVALVETAASLPAPSCVKLMAADEFRLIGRPLHRLEVPDMVVGRVQYGIDVTRPQMLYAVVLRCPEFGGRVSSCDSSAANESSGVHAVLEMESGIAVVADSVPAALRGRDKLHVQWQAGPNAELDSARIRGQLLAALERRATVARDEGDASRALKRSGRVLEAVYETPYLAHAAMEPLNCIAHVTSDRCDLWAGTQAQQGARAKAMEISFAAIGSTPNLGGGFGRRLEQDFIAEAVRVGKAVGRPVQVLWTRSDDMQHDWYRSRQHHRFQSRIGRERPAESVVAASCGPALSAGRDRCALRDRQFAPGEHRGGSGRPHRAVALRRRITERVRHRVFRRRAGVGSAARFSRLPPRAAREITTAPRGAGVGRGEVRLGESAARATRARDRRVSVVRQLGR
jgi:isoquinoline 1-oxidoreductase beta subunit